MQTWSKLGLIYRNELSHPKLSSHAANPLFVHQQGSVYRCFFSARDDKNRSSVGAFEFDIDTRKVLSTLKEPLFEYGGDDSFFSHGVSIGNCYNAQGVTYIPFMGWKNDISDHWYGQIGRLVMAENGALSLDSSVPFLPIDSEDPISLSYPWVLKHNGVYKMWYGSTVTWDAGNREMLHIIKYAESCDGHIWSKKGQAIPHALGKAQAFSRPTVWVDGQGRYSMWFSYRSGAGEGYHIGQSFSDDGLNWSFPERSLVPSDDDGWDSLMVEYPYAFEHGGQLYLAYNGNGYGESGIGLATLENTLPGA